MFFNISRAFIQDQKLKNRNLNTFKKIFLMRTLVNSKSACFKDLLWWNGEKIIENELTQLNVKIFYFLLFFFIT